MSSSGRDADYTVRKDGLQQALIPPIVPAGIVVANKSDRAVYVADGRAWHRRVPAGSVARYVITSPALVYTAQLDAASHADGDCVVTFTTARIDETGDPPSQGGILFMADGSLNLAPLSMETAGADYVDVFLQRRSTASPATSSYVLLTGAWRTTEAAGSPPVYYSDTDTATDIPLLPSTAATYGRIILTGAASQIVRIGAEEGLPDRITASVANGDLTVTHARMTAWKR